MSQGTPKPEAPQPTRTITVPFPGYMSLLDLKDWLIANGGIEVLLPGEIVEFATELRGPSPRTSEKLPLGMLASVAFRGYLGMLKEKYEKPVRRQASPDLFQEDSDQPPSPPPLPSTPPPSRKRRKS